MGDALTDVLTQLFKNHIKKGTKLRVNKHGIILLVQIVSKIQCFTDVI